MAAVEGEQRFVYSVLVILVVYVRTQLTFWYFVGLIIHRYDRQGGGGGGRDDRGYVPIGLFLQKIMTHSFSRLFCYLFNCYRGYSGGRGGGGGGYSNGGGGGKCGWTPQFNALFLFDFSTTNRPRGNRKLNQSLKDFAGDVIALAMF